MNTRGTHLHFLAVIWNHRLLFHVCCKFLIYLALAVMFILTELNCFFLMNLLLLCIVCVHRLVELQSIMLRQTANVKSTSFGLVLNSLSNTEVCQFQSWRWCCLKFCISPVFCFHFYKCDA